jgi:hypothetical protein
MERRGWDSIPRLAARRAIITMKAKPSTSRDKESGLVERRGWDSIPQLAARRAIITMKAKPSTSRDKESGLVERRGWDSNPRYLLGTRALQARPFDRSGTSPHYTLWPSEVYLLDSPVRIPRRVGGAERVGFDPAARRQASYCNDEGEAFHPSGQRIGVGGAERVGFEPTVPDGYTRFRGVRLRPLGHLSKMRAY